MAIGIDRGLHLVTDGEEWDPEATAGAIVDAIRADEAASGPFDLIFFGNESADSGGFQVGLRVALTRSAAPARPGSRASSSVEGGGRALRAGDRRRARRLRAAAAGRRDGARGAQPAALSVRAGRMRAGRKPLERDDARAARVHGSSADAPRRARPARRSRPRCSGTARRRPRPSSTCSSRSGWHREPRARRARRRRAHRRLAAGARARRRRSAGEIARAPDRAGCGRGGGRRARSPSPTSPSTTRSTPSRPMRGRRSSAGSPTGSGRDGDRRARAPGPRPTRWRGRPCGSASRSRRTCTAVTPGEPLQLTRVRWGGSLLEEARAARRDGAPHGRAARGRSGRPGRSRLGRVVHARARRRPTSSSAFAIALRRRRAASRSPTRRSSSPAAAASARRRASHRSRSSPRCSAAPSAARAR